MIQINLLPVRGRKRRDTSRQFVSIFLLSILLMVAVIGYLWTWQSHTITSLNKRLGNVEKEVDRYAKYDVMLQELKKKKEIVDKKRAVADELQRDRDRIVRIMALLSVEMPAEKMWIEKLSQSADAMTLNGVALSNETIAEFMKNLESSPYVQAGSVSLTHSRQVSMGNMKLREFQLAYRFLPFSGIQEKVQHASKQPG